MRFNMIYTCIMGYSMMSTKVEHVSRIELIGEQWDFYQSMWQKTDIVIMRRHHFKHAYFSQTRAAYLNGGLR